MFLCLIYYDLINSGVEREGFFIGGVWKYLAGRSKSLIFKLGGNRAFEYFLKFIGLYYSQGLIHLKFIFIFYDGACSTFRVFVVLALMAPPFPLRKLWDISGVHRSKHKPVKKPSKGGDRFCQSHIVFYNYHNKKKMTIKCGPGLPGGP